MELHAERGGGGTGREVGEGGLQGVGRDVATGHRAGEVGGVGRKLGCVGSDDAIDGRGGGDGIGASSAETATTRVSTPWGIDRLIFSSAAVTVWLEHRVPSLVKA